MFNFKIIKTQVIFIALLTISLPTDGGGHVELEILLAPQLKDGTPQSCKEIKDKNPFAKSGPYLLGRGDWTEHQAYCDMTNDDGGWTLVAKIQEPSSSWSFDKASWDSPGAAFNINDFNLENGEARYPSFESVAFEQIRLLDPRSNGTMILSFKADNLLSVFRPGERKVPVIRYIGGFFNYLTTNDYGGHCQNVLDRLTENMVVNTTRDYPSQGNNKATTSVRLGAVELGSNDRVWAETVDCGIGLGVTTRGYGGSKGKATTAKSGFTTVWVR